MIKPPQLNPIVVALDVETESEALELVNQLKDLVGMFKIGNQLFTAVGPAIVRKIIAGGGRVFLDLKFHDIPNTVASAGVEATRLGVSIFNIHATGGAKMMKAVVESVSEIAERERIARPQILGVTVLTSHTQNSLTEVGIEKSLADEVVLLAGLCAGMGVDGVVASPHEIVPIRQAITDNRFIILTPGVRPAGAEVNDQSRIMTPAEAIKAGADYLVIGRPITKSKTPALAAKNILEEIELL
jgi:orotidine-5'-phosphate decarboxylase